MVVQLLSSFCQCRFSFRPVLMLSCCPQDADDVPQCSDLQVPQVLLVQISHHVQLHPVLLKGDGIVGGRVWGDACVQKESHPLFRGCHCRHSQDHALLKVVQAFLKNPKQAESDQFSLIS